MLRELQDKKKNKQTKNTNTHTQRRCKNLFLWIVTWCVWKYITEGSKQDPETQEVSRSWVWSVVRVPVAGIPVNMAAL